MQIPESPRPFQNQDSSPFLSQLEPLIPYERMTKAHIMQLESRPDKVVRVSLRDNVDHNPKRETTWLLDLLKTGDQLLDTLTNQYGIAVVKHAHILGPSPDDPNRITPYTVTDRVLGDTLRDELEKELPSTSQQEVAGLYSGLIDYHHDVLTNGGTYLSDISRNNTQYMVGPTAEDPVSRIYLTDVDPITRDYDPKNPTDKQRRDINRSIGTLAGCIDKAAQLTGWDFTEIIEKYFDALDVVPEGSEFRHWVDDLKAR